MFNIKDLKPLLDNQPLLSLYLNVNPALRENQATTAAWRIWLKDALREIDRQHDKDETWQALRARVDEFFTTYRPESKGLALFFGEVMEQTVELPVDIENRASYGKPSLAPLVWAMDEYEPYLIVRVDHERAHFIVAQLGSVQRTENMKLELRSEDWYDENVIAGLTSGVASRPTASRDRFEARVAEHVERFYRDVAVHTQALCKQHQLRRVIVGGIAESAHALRDLLGQENVIDILSVSMHDSPAQVLEKALPVAEGYERKLEAELVEEVIDLAKAGGRGALGRGKVKQAFGEGRVELLIVSFPPDDYKDIEELTTKALEANSKIELVHGDAADRLNGEGGVAARLYYAY